MIQEWSIQGRSQQCSVTSKPFVEGERYHALLFLEAGQYRREDLCEEAWRARDKAAAAPFSHWRAKYEPPPPLPQEALAKQTAEDLLRAYMDETSALHAAARYLLAVMLERKRILKEIEVKREGDKVYRIYAHSKTGEVFVIPDPKLELDKLADVQEQVSALLSAPTPQPIPPPPPTIAEAAAPTAEETQAIVEAAAIAEAPTPAIVEASAIEEAAAPALPEASAAVS